jgi:hypothetical protein
VKLGVLFNFVAFCMGLTFLKTCCRSTDSTIATNSLHIPKEIGIIIFKNHLLYCSSITNRVASEYKNISKKYFHCLGFELEYF